VCSLLEEFWGIVHGSWLDGRFTSSAEHIGLKLTPGQSCEEDNKVDVAGGMYLVL
jgi:hypothetical protein